MATTIKLKNSVTTTNTPSSLAQGEVAINITDKKVWVGNAATTPVQLLGDGGSATFSSITVTGVSTFSAGTVSAPSITTSGDTNTGIFFPAADTIAFTEGGVESMRITSAGYVGIGTSSPSVTLHVDGTGTQYSRVSSSTHSNFIQTFSANGSTGHEYKSVYRLVDTDAGERMRIDSSGNVAINTTSGSGGRLVIAQANSTQPAIYLPTDESTIQGPSTDTQIRMGGNIVLQSSNVTSINAKNASGYITFNTGATPSERMRITSGGDVFVGGTTSAVLGYEKFSAYGTGSFKSASSYALGVWNTANTGLLACYTEGGGTFAGGLNASGASLTVFGGSNLNLSSTGANFITLNTNSTERMRITSGGDVYVGTTSALSNTAKIQINGGASSTITSQTTGTGATDHVNFRNDNGKIGTITTNGSATAYNTSSDYRLKENIAPMTGALNVVQSLNPVTYTWKADGSSGQGFIAHELQAIVPDCVTGEKDAVDTEGNPVYQGIDVSFLVATLTAAIQEQQQIIYDLKIRIETLESK